MVGICSTVGKQAKRMPDTIVKTTTTNSIYCNYCLTWLMSPLKHGKIFKNMFLLSTITGRMSINFKVI